MLENERVVVIGAGPHGLAVVLHLAAVDPTWLERVTVVDPAGDWLAAWRSAFARLGIERLRSPVVHHPGPNPEGLLRWQRETGAAASGLPYDIPRFDVFDGYCAELIARADLGGAVTASRVWALRPGSGGAVEVDLDGRSIVADRVVMASNPHRRRLPEWLWAMLPMPRWRIQHADDVDLRGLDVTGDHVVVVGGGLTAAHLAAGAAAAGGQVTMVTRRRIRERLFDVHPGWLGPRYLQRFARQADPRLRYRAVQAARGGGSIPEWMLTRLRGLADTGQLQIVDACPVVAARRQGGRPQLVLADHRTLTADRLWLATGTEATLAAARSLTAVTASTPAVRGLPCLHRDLRLPGTPIHVMGRFATLALGPAAGNLWGARMAALAITEAVTGVSLGTTTPIASHPLNDDRGAASWPIPSR